ncbi:MAG: fructosamine kinase family protein [Cellulomonas sp.]
MRGRRAAVAARPRRSPGRGGARGRPRPPGPRRPDRGAAQPSGGARAGPWTRRRARRGRPAVRQPARRLAGRRVLRPARPAAAHARGRPRALGRVPRGLPHRAAGRGRRALLRRLADRLRSGALDDDDVPARLHGDLWSGNVLWTPTGATLIDPAAHGGHRESDLAMLALFGFPHLSDVLDAYQEVHPLRRGWQHRVGLHQVYPVGMHAVLFGGGYAAQLRRIAAPYV